MMLFCLCRAFRHYPAPREILQHTVAHAHFQPCPGGFVRGRNNVPHERRVYILLPPLRPRADAQRYAQRAQRRSFLKS